jgi:hypothetical protein
MRILEKQFLRVQAVRLADLIASAGPAKMQFGSEEQFLAVIGLQLQPVAVQPRKLAWGRLHEAAFRS